MKKLSVWFCLLSSVFCPLFASAQVPQLINYQGRLLNGTNLVNGNVGLSLRLFNVLSGGTAICEDSNTVSVVDGLYSTLIGDDLGPGLELAESPVVVALTNEFVYIEVAVNGITLSPRERIVSTAYALHPRRSDIFTGSVADSQLSANIARLNATNQSFIGPVNFTSTSNTFTGTFSGDAGSLTNVLYSALVANR